MLVNMTIEVQIDKYRKEFNSLLSKYIKQNIGNNTLDKAIKYSLTIGGKRVRPFISSMISKDLGLGKKESFAISLASEMVHTYTLIHDDLPSMDNDDLRRGNPTTHIKFNEANAILAGNSIFSMAINILIKNISKKKNDSLLKIIELLCNVSGLQGLAKGQSLDLEMQNKKKSIKKMLEINRLKTSKLFEFCVASPFILSKSPTKYIKEAKLFSNNLGLIFQITDDMIDLENKNYQNMNNFCIKLIAECTKKKSFFGERNLIYQDFLYYVLNRKK